ncbi:MAG: sensor histidine kinase [Candidatus Zhuqueibacterota bacterium]
MKIFLFWVIAISLILAVYSWIIYRRSPKGFRFQVKLTIIFFLLVLIPAVPLTYFVSGLLTTGVEMLLLPGIENSLSQSLEVIRFQLEERGHNFFRANPAFRSLTREFLTMQSIAYIAELPADSSFPPATVLGPGAELMKGSPLHRADILTLVRQGEVTSNLFTGETGNICEVYHDLGGNNVGVVAFAVSDHVLRAKEQISESLRIYKSLSLIKKSVVEAQIIWGLATIFIIMLALSAIYAGKILSRGISEPIKELVVGMQRVASGDLTRPVDVKAKDELKFLITSFNTMARDLQTSQEKLVQAERLAAWQDVARRVSHEIRNALTPIQLSLHRLQTHLQGEVTQPVDSSISVIQEEVESLRRISEEFSQFARMPKITRAPENVNDIVRSLANLIEAEPHAISLRLTLDEAAPEVSVDRDQIKRALHNLVKNSIDASSIGGVIFIETKSVAEEKFRVKIIVRDMGNGIPAEDLEKIFEPYFTTKKRGMGLGLSIVKRIIEDHDGKIAIESALHKGTTITVLL